MPNTNYTHISLVLDRSRSMESCRQATIDGFNKYLVSQLEDTNRRCTVSLSLFNQAYTPLYSMRPARGAPSLGSHACPYVTEGSTALLGAMGRAIDDLGVALYNMSEHSRPGKVLFVTVTDGEENYSHFMPWSSGYTAPVVADKIKHQQERYNWEFVFLGANQDAIMSGAALSIKSAVNFDSTPIGMANAFTAISRATKSYNALGERYTSGLFFNNARHVDDLVKQADNTTAATNVAQPAATV